jgi:hypothetical protein
MLIYPKKRSKKSLSYATRPGTAFRCQDKIWVASEVFCECKRHFVSIVKPMPQEKMLIILDGCSSHNLSEADIEIIRRHGVVMLLQPSHRTQRMQPPDITFFKDIDCLYGISHCNEA